MLLAYTMAASTFEMSPTKNAALRDALVDLMRRAGTELNVGEAEVLVNALSAEISGRVAGDRKRNSSSKDMTCSPTKSESSVSIAPPIIANDRRHETDLATGSSAQKPMDSETRTCDTDEVDGSNAQTEWNPRGVVSLAQDTEIVYADDGYQSTSALAALGTTAGGPFAQEEWDANREWLEK